MCNVPGYRKDWRCLGLNEMAGLAAVLLCCVGLPGQQLQSTDIPWLGISERGLAAQRAGSVL